MSTTSKLLTALALLSGSVVAKAALISTYGGLGIYDTVNNVTWTSDANLFATQAAQYSGGTAAFITAVIAASGGVIIDTPNMDDTQGTFQLSANDFIPTTGQMNWWGAQAWVHYFDVTNFGGSNQWALPTPNDSINPSGYPDGLGRNDPSSSSSQMAQLFYTQLGGTAGPNFLSSLKQSSLLFTNIQNTTLQNTAYWSSTEYSQEPNSAWSFLTSYGAQEAIDKGSDGYAFAVAPAVAPGQLNSVPVPPSAWLMLSGLGGLAAIIKRRRAV